ncbi:MAG TPA: hypothetical protein VKY40_07965 [Halanaerobiales bacterium]|nr:hypothetical protein [Halanaerobiales bacterium]
MKKCLILMVAVLVFAVGSVAMADEISAGSVEFDVIWEVEPMILFNVGIGWDFASFYNGELVLGNADFRNYVFDSRTPGNPFMSPFGTEDIHGPYPIWAWVASNDKWRVQFKKPALENESGYTVPVYARRDLYDWANDNWGDIDWFAGDDTITRNMGIYNIVWNLKVEYNNWLTRSGVYENTYEIVCTQL